MHQHTLTSFPSTTLCHLDSGTCTNCIDCFKMYISAILRSLRMHCNLWVTSRMRTQHAQMNTCMHVGKQGKTFSSSKTESLREQWLSAYMLQDAWSNLKLLNDSCISFEDGSSVSIVYAYRMVCMHVGLGLSVSTWGDVCMHNYGSCMCV